MTLYSKISVVYQISYNRNIVLALTFEKKKKKIKYIRSAV